VHDRAVRYFEHPELRDHRDAMVARANRLVNLRYLGRDEEAHAEGLILLEERRRVLGPRHPHTIASELGAIEQLIHGGAVDQANLDLDRVRDVLAAMPDDRHRPLRVRAATTQAMLHRIEGDSHAAVEESERALALQAEEHGPDALVTHFSRLNLVLALLDAGRPEAAEPLFERVEADPAFMALGGWAEALRSLAEGRLLEWKGVPDTAAARIRDAHALLQRIAEPGNPHLDFAAAALGRVERP